MAFRPGPSFPKTSAASSPQFIPVAVASQLGHDFHAADRLLGGLVQDVQPDEPGEEEAAEDFGPDLAYRC